MCAVDFWNSRSWQCCDDPWELACKTTGPATLESASNFGAFPETQPWLVSTKPLGWWLDLQRFILLPFANEEIFFLTWDNPNIIVFIVVDVGPVYATCATWTMMVSFHQAQGGPRKNLQQKKALRTWGASKPMLHKSSDQIDRQTNQQVSWKPWMWRDWLEGSWPFRETPVFCRQFTFWQGLLSNYVDRSFVGCPPSQLDTNGNSFKKCSGFHGW